MPTKRTKLHQMLIGRPSNRTVRRPRRYIPTVCPATATKKMM